MAVLRIFYLPSQILNCALLACSAFDDGGESDQEVEGISEVPIVATGETEIDEPLPSPEPTPYRPPAPRTTTTTTTTIKSTTTAGIDQKNG